MKKVCQHVIADGNAMNIELGFVPDYVRALAKFEETSPVTYEWWKELANTANSNGQYGITRPADGSAPLKLSGASGGFASYDTATIKAMIPAPNGNGEVAATIAADFVAGATAPTARTTSIVGTVVRPSTHNGFLYECTVTAGVYGTEPTTWGTVLGETTSDGTNTWICREEKLKKVGARGITIGADISTNTDEWIVEAELWDSIGPEKDSDSYDPIGKHSGS